MILGSAAGGGLPQWNCGCEQCAGARAGRIPSRTQASVAISANPPSWFLVNASPDLRAQLLGSARLQSPQRRERGSPIDGVLLTSADLDHVLGLLLLREHDEPVHVHAPAALRETLSWLEALLRPFCGLIWHEPPGAAAPLPARDGAPSGLTYRCIRLTGEGGKNAVAYALEDAGTGGLLVVAPDVPEFTPELCQAMNQADVVFADGTFWAADELQRISPGKREAGQMGHLPLSRGALEVLRNCRSPTKALIHINNTNPILNVHSPERAAVEAAGVIVAEDGMRFAL